MQWTTEPPTEAGWYWVRRDGDIDVVEVDSAYCGEGGALYAWFTGNECEFRVESLSGEWYGPLLPPS